MTDLFKTYGLPKVIHSDNGTPFAAPNGILNLTTLAVWWITLGILPDRSLKGHPEQNGSLERMHKIEETVIMIARYFSIYARSFLLEI